MEEFIFRHATLNDIPFLVDTIIEAEKSGTNVLTYSTIFGLSEIEARKYIEKMLQEEIDGCELSISSFFLGERFGKIVGAVGAWYEGSEGISSTIIKGNLLSYVLPSSCLIRAKSLKHIVRDLHIEYLENTIQIGLVYVVPEARGKGLVTLLINHVISILKEANPSAETAYIQLFGNNTAALRAYKRAGFKTILVNNATLPEILNYMPYKSKILMKKEISLNN